jgi:AAA domain
VTPEIGKTILGMNMAAAIAAAANFLRWVGQRRARVMYLDGELPVETFKERMQLIAARYGEDLQFYGYNRESLGIDGMPPLNTLEGQAWLRREIEAVKPDVIFFDSIMCLLIGSMLEEATWMPMRPFVRELTARRIAQIYFNHSNEAGKSFGDKTREWEMDTTAKLSKPEGDEFDEAAFKFEFIKARLRTPATADQFKPMIIYPDTLRFEESDKSAGGSKKRNQAEFVAAKFLETYDRLADGVTKTPGHDGKPVSKVSVDAIREEMARKGFLKKDGDAVSSTGRSDFHRAKIEQINKGKLTEDDGLIWRP